MEIRIDEKDLNRVNFMLAGIGDSAPKVQSRALNKTLAGVKTDKSAAIRDRLNLSKKYTDKHISVRKSNPQQVSGRVDTRSQPVGLINFKGTGAVKNGVSVKVLKNGARKIIRHAFIAEAKGARNVFQRDYDGPRRPVRPGFPYARLPRQYRYTLKRLTGPRLTDNLGKPGVIRIIEQKAGERLIKNISHELSRELSRL